MDDVLLFAKTDEKVVRLHISVDELVVVKELKPLDKLVGYH